MKLLDHLNLYFGNEASNMKEFVKDFKDEYEGGEEDAFIALLMFLNSYSKVESQ
ncbi:hypothetical protein [Virgibacillus profundi]|uniref:hypothetical protein n=1 Tax=Virgibacillus profundi TaxID=2024555 RepID=UPI0013FD17B6|nr:hypothetical protein [Virgibacillus profundi]